MDQLSNAIETIDSVIENANHYLLRNALDEIYQHSPQIGLNAEQLELLIKVIGESSAITTATKLFIIENCLVPNGVVSESVVIRLVNYLGTSTATNQYKLEVPKSIQVELLKWLVNIIYLVPIESLNIDSATWLHLWQYDYLQKWITYMVIWSTTKRSEVKLWKVQLVERIAFVAGYQDVSMLATAILKRFNFLVGSSQKISAILSKLDCSQRKLSTFQNFTFNTTLFKKIIRVLNNSSILNERTLNENLKIFTNQLKNTDYDSVSMNRINNIPAGKTSILDVPTLEFLVSRINDIVVPSNPEFLFDRKVKMGLKITSLIFNQSVMNSTYLNTDVWIKSCLSRCFNQHDCLNESSKIELAKSVLNYCFLDNDVVPQILQRYMTIEYYQKSPTIFILMAETLIPILPVRSEITDPRKFILSILVIVKYKGNNYYNFCGFSRLCKATMYMMQNWFGNITITSKRLTYDRASNLLNDLKNIMQSNLQNYNEERSMTAAIILLLRLLTQVPDSPYRDSHIEALMISKSLMNKLFTLDDPLILDACCHTLINFSNLIENTLSANNFRLDQNQYIMDLTNYLWRNKVSTSKFIFSIPMEFVSNSVSNLATTHNGMMMKSLFTLNGVFAFSYLSYMIMKKLEVEENTAYKYKGVINESNFHANMKIANDRKQVWIKNSTNFSDFNFTILQNLAKRSQYKNISEFLKTFVKSLNQYQYGN